MGLEFIVLVVGDVYKILVLGFLRFGVGGVHEEGVVGFCLERG